MNTDELNRISGICTASFVVGIILCMFLISITGEHIGVYQIKKSCIDKTPISFKHMGIHYKAIFVPDTARTFSNE